MSSIIHSKLNYSKPTLTLGQYTSQHGIFYLIILLFQDYPVTHKVLLTLLNYPRCTASVLVFNTI